MANNRTWYNKPPEPLFSVKQSFLTMCRSTEEEVVIDIMMNDAQTRLGYEDYTPLTGADIFHFIDTFMIPDTGKKIKTIKTSYSEIARRRHVDAAAIRNVLKDLHEKQKLILEEYKTDPDRIKITFFKKRRYRKRSE